jgi:hypothetical protein
VGGGIGTEGAGGFIEAGAEGWGFSGFADLVSSSGFGSLIEE